jgi:excisionase family DNA binding protein
MSVALQRASERSIPTLALTFAEAAAALGVSDDFFREHVAGDLRVVRRGRKKLVAVRELERWLDQSAAKVFEEAGA